MSWQGQSPEKPLGAKSEHPTSVAPPGFVERPIHGPTKASTTPRIEAPPAKRNTRLTKAVVIIGGGFIALVILIALALPTFIGHQTNDLPPGWQNTTGAATHVGFTHGCNKDDDAQAIKDACQCVFKTIAAEPEYDTPQKFAAMMPEIDRAGSDINRLPQGVRTAILNCAAVPKT
jgi:hypothetical protein